MLANIEASFTDAESMSLSNIKHPGGKEYEHLTPTAVLPVLPDEVCWENEYVQASFDVDPSLAAAGETEATYSKERVARAIAKQFKADGDKRFLGYLLPPEGYAPEQGGEMEEGVPMEWVRDYDFHMRDYSAFFLSVNDEGALYNAFEKRFTMTRSSFLTRNKRPKSITLSRSEQEEKEEGTKANLLKGAGAAQANLLKGPAALTYTGGGEEGGHRVVPTQGRPVRMVMRRRRRWRRRICLVRMMRRRRRRRRPRMRRRRRRTRLAARVARTRRVVEEVTRW